MNIEKQLDIIRTGTVQIISEADLQVKIEKAAKDKRKLRIKYGADPSAPDIHLGHTVPLEKLRQFQELGHEVVFIIGDFTAMIGDPSGRSETRKPLTTEQVKENSKTYKKQVFKILKPELTEVVFNSHWLGKLGLQDIILLTSKYTVAQMLERDDFLNRYKKGAPISMVEFLYPLMQGYDSVYVKSDVELGGTDQTFNLLVSRAIQKEYGQDPQSVITMPILEGTDGVNKMSKSLGNYIGVNDVPVDMYGKVMSISDSLMLRYYQLLLHKSDSEIKTLSEDIKEGKKHPMEVKKLLAKDIVVKYWGEAKAQEAQKEFSQVFSRRELPTELPEIILSKQQSAEKELWIIELIGITGALGSKGEARRLVKQGGVTVDDKKISDENAKVELKDELILKVGKRQFFKIRKP